MLAGASIVAASTANSNARGARHRRRAEHAPGAAHWYTSTLPWHSRTSAASKWSKLCASTFEVKTKNAPALSETAYGSAAASASVRAANGRAASHARTARLVALAAKNRSRHARMMA